MQYSLLCFALLFLSSVVKAQLVFNDFKHYGTGCPQGSLALSESPDGQSASILFDQFSAQVPQYDGDNDNAQVRNGRLRRSSNDPKIQHKACNLGFNVTIPDGKMVEALEISVYNRGSTILDPGVRASLSTIFVGSDGLRNSQQNVKPQVTVVERRMWGAMRNRNQIDVFDDWVSEPVQTIPIQSGCAHRSLENNIRFELKNHLEVEIMDSDLAKTGLIVMDSSDISGSLKMRVITKPCSVSNQQRPPRYGGGISRPPRPPRRYR